MLRVRSGITGQRHDVGLHRGPHARGFSFARDLRRRGLALAQRLDKALDGQASTCASARRGTTRRFFRLLHSICATLVAMKTAQLPPVRVEPTVREEIESVLLEGESLSQFVETATVQAARRRKAQQAFLARGRASLANAKATGEFYPLHGVLDQMRGRLDARMDEQRRARRVKSKKP